MAPQPQILIVDDSPVNIALLGEILQDYQCLAALDGTKALAIALEQKPDIILLDIVMPDLDGYEVCRRLKAQPETADIPIIFITAQQNTESILKGFDAGAIDYIAKPFNIKELLARVRTQLAIKKANDENEALLQHIQNYNKTLTDSMIYARMLQKASLPSGEMLARIMPPYFILNKPRNVVSGDFYWVRKIDHQLVVVVGDCTGHGVPGAIMSMLGIAYLNEIVGENQITSPAAILNLLREKIVESLSQDSPRTIRDGMNMSVLTIHFSHHMALFAGAYQPLFVLRHSEIQQFASNRMPVGYTEQPHPFTEQRIELHPHDYIYLTTDGIWDQFGGPLGKKLMRTGFVQFVKAQQHVPIELQQNAFTHSFESWKGEEEQVDDVLVLGMYIP